MKLLTEIAPATLEGVTVIVRSGLNIPLDGEGHITDDLRLRRALPTLMYLQNAGARVVVVAHIGRKPDETLRPIFERLATTIQKCTFSNMRIGSLELTKLVSGMGNGEVLMLENIRREGRETENDMSLARDIAGLGQLFVSDAFPDSHRAQPSIVGVPPLLPHCAGLALADEVHNLRNAFTPKHPSIAFVAGSKFETKEPLIRTLLTKYDEVFVGGALANDILVARGHAVGKSVVGDSKIPDEIRDNPKLIIPRDVIVERASGVSIVSVSEIGADDIVVDIGPETIIELTPKIQQAQFIVWNGPMGWYEKGYTDGSRALGDAIALSSATSVLGGGDTVASIERPEFRPEEQFDFVSAGGGAMLEFLLDGNLPGIAVLES